MATSPSKFTHADRIRVMQQLGAAVASGAEVCFDTAALRLVYDLVQDASILAASKELELISAGHVKIDMEQAKQQVCNQLLEAGWTPPVEKDSDAFKLATVYAEHERVAMPEAEEGWSWSIVQLRRAWLAGHAAKS